MLDKPRKRELEAKREDGRHIVIKFAHKMEEHSREVDARARLIRRLQFSSGEKPSEQTNCIANVLSVQTLTLQQKTNTREEQNSRQASTRACWAQTSRRSVCDSRECDKRK